ncbi:POB3 [Enterospora canceri]|uniref:POB3 n=1 Tax=Enterospora canceri TaxID=1081671 RepID=A0A1Y1S585_9MICR|nr:POB3 [Enterospora canceri]
MSDLTLEQVVLNNQIATVKMANDGIAFKTAGAAFSIKKDEIKNMEIFRGIQKYCFRIVGEKDVYDILNVDESHLRDIKQNASQSYGISIPTIELENLATTDCNMIYNSNLLTFSNESVICSIPKGKIDKIVEIDNELQFHIGETEVVLSTKSKAIDFLKNKVSEEICVISNLNCVNPRSRSAIIFFEKYFESRGSSYDHIVFYKNVKELLFLGKENAEQYMVLRLETPLLQGQTKYESMVFALEKKEVEVTTKDSRLRSYYNGTQDEVVVEIFEAMLGIKAQTSEFQVKCTNKINDGHLFFMQNGIQFLPKPISIGAADVILVEFSRLNVSAMQAKTFDMVVHAERANSFNSISKDMFSLIEDYFKGHGVKMVSEVIEDEYSGPSNEESESESDISSIIARSDELD